MFLSKPSCLIVFIFLHIAAISDVRLQRIPNLLTLAALFPGGFVFGFPYVCRLVFLCFLFFPLFHLHLLGAGDIKLLAVVFAWCGVEHFLLFFFLSLLMASLPSAFLFLKGARRSKIPMAPFFLSGFILSNAFFVFP